MTPDTASTRELERVRAQQALNAMTLSLCRRHYFVRAGDTPAYAARWRCASCGGEVDEVAARWYRIGLDHGRTLAHGG